MAPAPVPVDFPEGCIACYARISDDKHEGLGVERQLDIQHAYVETLGLPWPIEDFQDNDKSASRFGRKPRLDFQRMVELVEAGALRAVCFWDIDRLFRRNDELEDLFKLIDSAPDEVRIYNANDQAQVLLNARGRKLLRYGVADAAHYSDKLSETVGLHHAQARKRGAWSGGKRPFGYTPAETKDAKGRRLPTLIVIPEEAALIREAATAVLRGASIHSICRDWNDRNIPTTTPGKVWRPAVVSGMLRSPRNAGRVPHHGEDVGPASWEAILPVDVWQQLQAKMDSLAVRTPSNPPRRSLLTGVLTCGVCGASLVSFQSMRGTRMRRCRSEPGRPSCGKVAVAVRFILPAIEEALFLHVDRTDFQALLRQVQADSGTLEVARELEAAKAQREEVKALTVSGAYDPQDGADMLRGLRDRIEGLRATLSRTLVTSPLEPYAGKPGALRAAWGGLTDDQKRTLMLATFGTIAVMPVKRRGGKVFDPTRVVFAPRFGADDGPPG
jgi:site-specific DNA recombinase